MSEEGDLIAYAKRVAQRTAVKNAGAANILNRLAAALTSRAPEGGDEDAEKDYADMRRFQAKFIRADHEVRALQSEVSRLRRERDEAHETIELGRQTFEKVQVVLDAFRADLASLRAATDHDTTYLKAILERLWRHDPDADQDPECTLMRLDELIGLERAVGAEDLEALAMECAKIIASAEHDDEEPTLAHICLMERVAAKVHDHIRAHRCAPAQPSAEKDVARDDRGL